MPDSYDAPPHLDDYGFSTKAIHATSFSMTTLGDPVAFPIFQSSTFHFASTEDMLTVGEHPDRGFAYSRASNPTVAAFEKAIALLEGAEMAAAGASGIAAIHAALLAVLSAGDHVVVTRDLYGGTYHLLTQVLSKLGITHTLVDMTDLELVRSAIQPATKMLWAETISNPTNVVLDIPSLASLAHEWNLVLGVDATFTSPYLSQPLAQGADIVAHSATKYIGGHGDVIAGVVSGSAHHLQKARGILIATGGTLGPFEAFLLLRGLKTLELRMERHCESARRVAIALSEHPLVDHVFYPALPDHPQHSLVPHLFRNGMGGGVVSFTVRGTMETARAVVDAVKLPLIAGSLGDTHTLISLPVMTSHRVMSVADRAACGVTDTLIRLPIGLENAPDLITDLYQALNIVKAKYNVNEQAV